MDAETTELCLWGNRILTQSQSISHRLFINYKGEMVPLKWSDLADIISTEQSVNITNNGTKCHQESLK